MIAPSSVAASLLVALGGGTGALLRFHLGRAVGRLFPAASGAFPFATLAANVIGSLCMGLLVGILARHGSDKGMGAEGWRLLVGVGLLGGFTTFSSFSLEILNLWERGDPALAAIYAAVSVAAGIAGLFLGLTVIRIAG
ncbi:fluoride efflux transporter CrcB [Croceicoccus ponticola]|uniref:Fluoride-specific ion channel FluC n=1 Tax=Croceicoccus ponticola TaxID=2217664 RepID=A0A437GWI7_9SPHN|nr:fluoride efflux transporter CrcB [Croceicoccus ponticola]RVQ66477.1 fluoride efflux transporter CrcB [Croceicoccus ponticola]